MTCVIVVNIADGPNSATRRATDPRRRILPHFDTDYMAPRDATVFYGSLWAEDGTFFLGPQRGVTILVLPDREVPQVLRRGVAKGWEEKKFIAHGTSRHGELYDDSIFPH